MKNYINVDLTKKEITSVSLLYVSFVKFGPGRFLICLHSTHALETVHVKKIPFVAVQTYDVPNVIKPKILCTYSI